MIIKKWLEETTHVLETENGTARLDAEVLLGDAFGKNRAWLLAHSDESIPPEILEKLNDQVKRRAAHEPLAYIRGKTEFYGREFIVNPSVLVPRPESETMIELLKTQSLKVETIIDVGTGSGALAVTAKLELPDFTVIATDIDEKCLVVASKNAQKHGVSITFLRGDLLAPLEAQPTPLTAILANLPYVPQDHTINQAAMLEPEIAIFGGPNGLDIYRKLFTQLSSGAYGTPIVLTESLPFQHPELTHIASLAGYKQEQEDDFIQLFAKS